MTDLTDLAPKVSGTQTEAELRELLARELKSRQCFGEANFLELENGRVHLSENRHHVLDAALAALRRLSRSEQGWRTIDSAPKDGTDIILWGPCRAEGDLRQFARDANIGWWCATEWRTRTNEICNATLWQPLPQPPLSASTALQGDKT